MDSSLWGKALRWDDRMNRRLVDRQEKVRPVSERRLLARKMSTNMA